MADPAPIGILKFVLALMLPGNDPKQVARWRSMVGLLILGFGVHVLWACGYGKAFGFAGFVTDTQFQTQMGSIGTQLLDHGKQLTEIQVGNLENRLIETRRQQCQSVQTGYFQQRLDELGRRYKTLTGQSWDVPSCENLK